LRSVRRLYESGGIDQVEFGTVAGLLQIREACSASSAILPGRSAEFSTFKGNFRLTSCLYL